MNILLWILQILFGIYFIGIGVMHFSPPAGLPAQMGWMYELPTWLHYISGAAEILGGLGLILPGLFKIQTRLTPLAALGLAIVMVGAVVYHLVRGETTNIVMNVILLAVMLFIYYGRTKLVPLKDRNAPAGAS